MATVDIGDVSLYYECVGDGPTILFVHGIFGDADAWTDQAVRLSDRYTCMRYDRRGYTRSAHDRKAGYPANADIGFTDLQSPALETTPADLAGVAFPALVLSGSESHPSFRSVAHHLAAALPAARGQDSGAIAGGAAAARRAAAAAAAGTSAAVERTK